MKISRAIVLMLISLMLAFTVATVLQPRTDSRSRRRHSGGILEQMLGDSRRMFAKDFYVKADVSFHSGYYPSIFDQARQLEEQENHMAEQGSRVGTNAPGAHETEEVEGGFLGPPTDWIDRFGRHFRITSHTHMAGANVREILPWLRVSADLDPQRVETYTVAAFFLRRQLGKVDEAEQFLREGLEANPRSYEILYELGALYFENRHDTKRARNLWHLAVRRWQEREEGSKDPDFKGLHNITLQLGHLEDSEGHYPEAISWYELTKAHSPHPEAVQVLIDTARAKLPPPAKQ